MRARIDAGLVLVTTARDACRMNGHRWWAWLSHGSVCVECGERRFWVADDVWPSDQHVTIDEIHQRRIDRKRSEVLLHRKDPPRRGPERSPLPGQKPHGTPPRWVR